MGRSVHVIWRNFGDSTLGIHHHAHRGCYLQPLYGHRQLQTPAKNQSHRKQTKSIDFYRIYSVKNLFRSGGRAAGTSDSFRRPNNYVKFILDSFQNKFSPLMGKEQPERQVHPGPGAMRKGFTLVSFSRHARHARVIDAAYAQSALAVHERFALEIFRVLVGRRYHFCRYPSLFHCHYHCHLVRRR